MSTLADRDLILAILRRLIFNGHLDAADVDAIASDVEAAGEEDHAQAAHEARLAVIEAAMIGEPVVNLDAERRRKEMRVRTAMLDNDKPHQP
jgi:hypothetical protein